MGPQRMLDAFWGRRDSAVTVPSMDGPLRPNRVLDDSPEILRIEAPDDLVVIGGRIFLSSTNQVFTVDRSTGQARAVPRLTCQATITCLAGHAADVLAVGISGGGIQIDGGPHHGRRIETVGGRALACPTAAAFADADTLFICQGSEQFRPEQWKRDLMEHGATGSVWRIDLRGGDAAAIAERLAFPNGVCVSPSGDVIVAEAWRHRLIAIAPSRRPEPKLVDLPGYPGRITPARDGGYWLPVFAPRRQMVEFVLREPEFRRRMIDEIDEAFWLAPSLAAGKTFLEPLQGGAVKQLGILKPWAPTLSCGLVARLDGDLQPVESFHSRADGARHGITACAEHDGVLMAASRGHDVVVAVDVAPVEQGQR